MSAKGNPEGKDVLFSMEIVDGFTFRGLVEILCNLNTEGIFEFTKQGCVYVNGDDMQNIIVKISIEKRLMISYHYSPSEESVGVYVPMGKFKDALKSVTKRDSLVLYQLYGDSNLYIGRSDNDDEQYISTLDGGQIQTFTDPVYGSGINSPSYVISTEELSRKFSNVGRGGATSGTEGQITITDDGEALRVNVEGQQGSGSRVKISRTQSSAPQLRVPQVFQLTRGIVKLLSKIQALYKGPVQFYTEEGKPLKLTCNIGTYGALSAYVRNITDMWNERKLEEKELKPVSVSPPGPVGRTPASAGKARAPAGAEAKARGGTKPATCRNRPAPAPAPAAAQAPASGAAGRDPGFAAVSTPESEATSAAAEQKPEGEGSKTKRRQRS